MYNFTSRDLFFNYSKTAVPGDDPHITGTPDSSRFSRHEQYEVLRLIRYFYKHNPSWNSAAGGQKIERMINNHLPQGIQSREDVCNWISNNWNVHV